MPKLKRVCILLPVYNDWESVALLLAQVNAEAKSIPVELHVLILNDGSSEELKTTRLSKDALSQIKGVTVLDLWRNLGHQRAIAVGLVYLAKESSFDGIIVMDADGEDDPRDLARLIEAFESDSSKGTAVFAKRAKRSEGLGFRVFYFIYRVIYRALTGQRIFVGNFSLLSKSCLERLVVTPEIWNHYAASFMKSRIPWESIDTERARRLNGESRMNFTALVIHGLSAISVHSEAVGIRSLISALLFIALGVTSIGVLVWIRLFTNLAIPGWTSTLILSIVIILFQALISSLLLSFIVLGGRNLISPVPSQHLDVLIRRAIRIF